jgi:hypothetical protein
MLTPDAPGSGLQTNRSRPLRIDSVYGGLKDLDARATVMDLLKV